MSCATGNTLYGVTGENSRGESFAQPRMLLSVSTTGNLNGGSGIAVQVDSVCFLQASDSDSSPVIAFLSVNTLLYFTGDSLPTMATLAVDEQSIGAECNTSNVAEYTAAATPLFSGMTDCAAYFGLVRALATSTSHCQ